MALKGKVGLMVCGFILTSMGAITNVSAVEFNGEGLGEDGKFHVKMVPPSNMSEQYALNEAIGELTGWDYGITAMGQWECREDFSACKLAYHGSDWTDDYYGIAYEYDMVAKTKIDAILQDFQVPEEGFLVSDAELLKYWAYGGSSLAAVSSAVKTALDNINLDFIIDVRGGGVDPLVTHNIGEAKVLYDDTLYAIVNNDFTPTKVVAPHIFYVPTESSDLAKALMDRFVAIYGEEARDAVSVEATDEKVSDLIDASSEFYEFFKDYSDAKVFDMNISNGQMGDTYKIIIVADSSKIEATSGVNSTDLLTDINIKTTAANLPGDVSTRAENLGANDETIAKDFGDKFNVYEIGLYSASLDGMVTDSDDGFVVAIPVPDVLKGVSSISAYWKNNEAGELEEHRGQIINGNVVFSTTHFSTYVLAESTEIEEDDDLVVPGVPDTGSKINGIRSVAASLPVFGLVMMVTGLAAFAVTRKK